jgi:antitoxin HicB
MQKKNPHLGSSFDDFLKGEGIFDEVQSKALERVLTELADESIGVASVSMLSM